MGPVEQPQPKHVCGNCNTSFETGQGYLNHVCTTGFAPTAPEHVEKLDPHFAKVSKAAQLRGAGRRILENDGVSQDTAKVIMAGVATENQAVSKIKKNREESRVGEKKEKVKPLPEPVTTAPPLEPLP